MGTLTFFLTGHPPLPNATVRWHWAKKGREAKVWRSAAFYAARDAFRNSTIDGQAVHPVSIHVKFMYRVARTRDVANLVASLKPVIDGLVDARVMVDDGPRWLPAPPQISEMVHAAGPVGIEVTVTEL